MATLVFDSPCDAGGRDMPSSAVCLRTWLRDGWSILFSHPNDFVRCELELDRWLVIVREAFAQNRIRPLALTAAGSTSWISQAAEDDRAVVLRASQPGCDAIDLPARTLRDTIVCLAQRFVMIIDSTLQVQRTYTYTPGSSVPSPLEFLAVASRLRRAAQSGSGSDGHTRTQDTRTPANNGTVCDIHSHHLFAMGRHRHRIPVLECRPLVRIRANRPRSRI